MLSFLKRDVPLMASGPAEENLIDSDVLIVDIGRNDFYEYNNPPLTVRNIKRIVKYLRTALATLGTGVAPVIAVSTLLPTKRLNQRFFITYTSDLLIEQKSSSFPVLVRLEQLKKKFVSSDGLHPTSAGYAKISAVIQRYLETKGTARALAARPDADTDGIYDAFEISTFGTNPSLTDSDLDNFSDGDEIFLYQTDPLDAQSHP